MKESEFIKQNKNKWSDFEKELNSKESKPAHISYHYIETIDDLSYAGTHYPNRMVRSYLNGIAQVLALKIYRSQRRYGRNIRKFWTTDLPLVMFESRWELLLSFSILILAVGIGIFSSMQDDRFASYILGQNYVNITLENIEKGDPMAIYKDKEQTEMFLGITFNNIMVSVYTYLTSLFFGIGTFIVIIKNGIMIGVFQYFFIERDLFFESFLTIWQHGTIEISCIVLAGTAGLVLAKGILFPGTLSRMNSFRLAGKKSLIIMLGLMPLLIYSGAIEGFVTRYTEMHWIVRLSTILLSLAFVLIYFVWYPKRIVQKSDLKEHLQLYIQPINFTDFNFRNIHTNSVILWESLMNFFRYRQLFTAVFLSISLAIALWLSKNSLSTNAITGYSDILLVFYSQWSNFLFLLNFVFFTLSIFMANWFIYKRAVKANVIHKKPLSVILPLGLSSIVIGALSAFCMNIPVLIILLFFLLPLLGYNSIQSWAGKDNFFISLSNSFNINGKSYLKMLGISAVSIIAGFVLIFSIQIFFVGFISGAVSEFLWISENVNITRIIYTFLICATIFSIYCLMFTGFALSWFSFQEIKHATDLRDRLNELLPPEAHHTDKQVSILKAGRFK